MISLETSVLQWIQTNMRSAIGDFIMPFISAVGNAGAIWIAAGVGYLFAPKHRRMGMAILLAIVLELFLCNAVLKPRVGRIRPCDIDPTIALLVPHPHDFSFPSGHTGASFAAAYVMLLGKSNLWVCAMVLAGLIAFSRLYLYVHYPTDVLAGIVLGILVGWFAWRVSAWLERLFG